MPSVGKLIAQVGKQIEDRSLGMPLDRKAHLHAGIGAGKHPAREAEDSGSAEAQVKRMDQIDKRLRELEAEEHEALHLPPAERVT